MKTSQHVAIVTHEHLPGAPHVLRDFLHKRGVGKVTFISHPLLNRSTSSYAQYFVAGKLKREVQVRRSWALPLISYPIDTLLTISWLWKADYLDWYIGVGPLNAIVGVLLKRLGKVKNVVFYSIDFVPRRFANVLLNALYHIIEKWSVAGADICWDVSPRIQEGRMLYLGLSAYERRVVPIGVEKEHVAKVGAARNSLRLGFVGHLLEKQGVQLILEAMPAIARKFPTVELLVIGGGEYKSVLERFAERLRIRKYVTFTGWISDQQEVARLLSTCVIGLAPYVPEGGNKTNFTYWADPTKLKTYLSAGLPVVVTDVPYNARELEARQCARVIPYESRELSDAVVGLLGDPARLAVMRKRALSYAKSVTWSSIFHKATGL